jgi:hypothetical protein
MLGKSTSFPAPFSKTVSVKKRSSYEFKFLVVIGVLAGKITMIYR